MTHSADSRLETHAGVRLYPPSPKDTQRWTVVELASLRRFRISPLGCMILVAFMGGRHSGEGLAEVAMFTRYPVDQLQPLLQSFQEAGLIVPPDHASHRFAHDLLRQWTRYGWVEAADHHLATFDYPYVNYEQDGLYENAVRMGQYLREEVEPERTKRTTNPIVRIPTLRTKAALSKLTTSTAAVWSHDTDLQPLNAERLFTLLCATFGVTRRQRTSRTGKRAPLVHKTSPSGGCRHPTEAYVIVLSVPGIESGVYHFAADDNVLGKLDVAPDAVNLARLFPGPLRAPFRPRALVVLTSVFERNAYRYREPRTLRTIFMDAGHLCATLEMTAPSLGILAYRQHGMLEDEIESLLGITKLSEGIIYGIALGGEGDQHVSD